MHFVPENSRHSRRQGSVSHDDDDDVLDSNNGTMRDIGFVCAFAWLCLYLSQSSEMTFCLSRHVSIVPD